jgi:hypothetical protein
MLTEMTTTRAWLAVMLLLIAMPSGKALTFNVDPAKVSAFTLFVFSSCVRVPNMQTHRALVEDTRWSGYAAFAGARTTPKKLALRVEAFIADGWQIHDMLGQSRGVLRFVCSS